MLCEEVESLLRQGYCFECFSSDYKSFSVRFYKHGNESKRFIAPDRKVPHMLVEDKNTIPLPYPETTSVPAIFPEDVSLIDSNLSRQLLWFVFEYGEYIEELSNWIGWKAEKKISMFIRSGYYYYLLKTSLYIFYFKDFKEKESASYAGLAEIAFPDVIAPVSDIIREYALYSLYDFLVENIRSIR